jgi:ADP-ribosylglycohydrolase
VEFLAALDPYLVDSDVQRGVARARHLVGVSPVEAAWELGNGSRVIAQDTVPFTLWVAATFLHDYPSAIMACVQVGGDVDTTAAIAGGIVAAHTGVADRPGVTGVPAAWIRAREPLPAWALRGS